MNDWEISNFDAETILKWITDLEVKTVIEFGPGRSTGLFLDFGAIVKSVETDERYFIEAQRRFFHENLTLLHIHNDEHFIQLADSGYDLGFVDGPAASVPGDRFWSLVTAMASCKWIIVHDSKRDYELLSVAKIGGWKIVAVDDRERGLTLLSKR